ncbi:MAG: hypothetical protein J3K34DRAFT_403898 [Monoraphidium minutum]|nr:MAG: hypothetical protein J3K34DRAFT_403898 [Monoraphidium minutum]
MRLICAYRNPLSPTVDLGAVVSSHGAPAGSVLRSSGASEAPTCGLPAAMRPRLGGLVLGGLVQRAARLVGAASAPRPRHPRTLALVVLLTLQAAALVAPKRVSGACQVVIRPSAKEPPAGVVLHLAEVQLFQSSGAPIDRLQLRFSLSSTTEWDGGVVLSANNCNDGITASIVFVPGTNVLNKQLGQICHSKPVPEDPTPTLTIAYPCATGLSRVVVTNRQDCCGSSIDAFSLDFIASTGEVTYTYTFDDGGDTPTYTIARTCAPGWRDAPECNRCMPGHGGKSCTPCRGKNQWAPGGSLASCSKCPKFAPKANVDKSSCVCLDPQLEFTSNACIPPCTGASIRDQDGECACTPGAMKNSSDCSQCLPGHGGRRCKPCPGQQQWSPGGSLEDCRKCPQDAPIPSTDKSSCG